MMHRRWPVLLFLLAFLASAAEATKLSGKVLDSELDGPPLSGVEIQAAGASSALTDELGLFTLDFPERQPGEVVELTVAREGYLVVNDVQLQAPLPHVAEDRPLTLLLCQPQLCEEMRRRFYRSQGFAAVAASYERRLDELEQSGQATAEERDRLEEERTTALIAAEKAAEGLARLGPGAGSAIYREALRHFVDGKLDDALAALRAEHAPQTPRPAEDDILRGQLLTLQLRFDEAEAAYQSAVASDPQSFAASFALAELAQSRNLYPQATSAYQRSLELARQQGVEADIARTLDGMGYLLRQQSRGEEARSSYEEALAIRRRMRNPDLHRPELAQTLNDLGNLYGEQNQPDKARKAYTEALAIRRQLVAENPDRYLPDLVGTLHNLALLFLQLNLLNESRPLYEETVATYRPLAKQDPALYLPDLARTLHHMAIVNLSEERWDPARSQIEEALAIRRELVVNDADILHGMADTLSLLALLDAQEGRTDEARQEAQEVLAIYRQLTAENPAAVSPGRIEQIEGLLQSLEPTPEPPARLPE